MKELIRRSDVEEYKRERKEEENRCRVRGKRVEEEVERGSFLDILSGDLAVGLVTG